MTLTSITSTDLATPSAIAPDDLANHQHADSGHQAQRALTAPLRFIISQADKPVFRRGVNHD
ncbi:MAG: hypothetical protein AB4050_16110 [Synechococcus sp.]